LNTFLNLNIKRNSSCTKLLDLQLSVIGEKKVSNHLATLNHLVIISQANTTEKILKNLVRQNAVAFLMFNSDKIYTCQWLIFALFRLP